MIPLRDPIQYALCMIIVNITILWVPRETVILCSFLLQALHTGMCAKRHTPHCTIVNQILVFICIV